MVFSSWKITSVKTIHGRKIRVERALLVFAFLLCSFFQVLLSNFGTRTLTLQSQDNFVQKNRELSFLPLQGEGTLHQPSSRVESTSPVSNKNPYLVLHVGPEKAASTYIQSVSDVIQDHFLVDNYEYHGGHKGSSNLYRIYDCPGHDPNQFDWTNCNLTECPVSQLFSAILEKNYKSHRNLFISNEYIWRKNATILSEAFLGNWNVKIIFMYRRLYERIVSQYNQLNQPERYYKNGRWYLVNYRWPKNGGPKIPSFSDWYYKEFNPQRHVRNTVESLTRYAEHFSVEILPIYKQGDDDLLTRLVCDHLPNTTHTCDTLRSGKASKRIQSVFTNPSEPLDYDRLAVHAYEKGLVNGRRVDIVKKTRIFIDNTLGLRLGDLPQICLNQSAQVDILNWSLKYEKFLLGNLNVNSIIENDSPSEEGRFREMFYIYAAKMRFCSVDVKKVLTNPIWISFFQSL